MDKISYALGLSMAANLKSSGFKSVNLDRFMKGMNDTFSGTSQEMSIEEAKKILSEHFDKMQKEADEHNKKAGEEFLKENAKRPGVVITASGLQYEILKEGNGAKPVATDTVRCHYEGRLIDGNVFDSSFKRNKPADFPVNQVIAGWVEALQLMPVGSKWRLFIPSELAYGEHGAGDVIGPNMALVFDVELIEVLK
ncbi:MAG: FKBP-type peptidyl-prolyl cis-trans isomerase [Paludibacteraceae bacterium]|nr:FKBP-type peptidyl-prolyl cis-trans isomerase [Paludibacteraceae bacterium]MEE3485333.1 FKBP-type peptidyl-prolyl cis-trans isomerase [Bacteroidales bacterium]